MNSMTKWMDQMRVFAAPHDDPEAIPAASRIEFHNPNGLTYFAKSHGKETVFGKTVHRGIAARVLEHANSLLDKAYVTTKVTNGMNTWYVPVIGSNGRPLVKFQGLSESVAGCRAVSSTNAAFDRNANFGTPGAASLAEYEAAYASCSITSNQAAIALEKYVTVPDFLRTAIEMTYGADLRGVY
jgi:hypothetical protein